MPSVAESVLSILFYFILFYFILFYPGHFLYFKVDRVTSPPPYSGSKLPVLGLRL